MRENGSFKVLNPGDRPRERLINYGVAALSDVELLALVLRSGDLRNSALDLAAEVLKEFGGFKGLLDVDIKQLLSFSGIGIAKATSIKSVCEISLRMQMLYECERLEITKPLDVFYAIRKYVYAKKREFLYILSLDAKSKLISIDLISVGTLTETLVHPREIFKKALLKSAVSVVLVHNHPSGDPKPSLQDISLTKRVFKAGIILGVPVVDHVVVCDDSFVSMKTEGYLKGGD